MVSKPAGLTFEQAAAIPIAATTALRGIRDTGEVKAGQRVLVNGAGGGVGTFAVQIAVAMGAEVTGVCSTRNVELVRSLGAGRVIDYTTEDFTNGRTRYDVILDNVSNLPLARLRGALTRKGTLVLNGGGSPGHVFGPIAGIVKAVVLNLFVSQRLRPLPSKQKREELLGVTGLIEEREARGGRRPDLSAGRDGRGPALRGAGARARQSGRHRGVRRAASSWGLLVPVSRPSWGRLSPFASSTEGVDGLHGHTLPGSILFRREVTPMSPDETRVPRGAREVRAPRGATRSCRSWPQEAAMRMLMNNLDPEVAERPEDLVVYGGTGRAARSWEAFDAIVRTLRTLADDETLLVQSGKPVAVFRTHEFAPRVLISNSMLVPKWADWDTFRALEAQGLTMYGQMTAGSWIYIGTQGILQGTYETLAECAHQHFGGSLKGTVTLTGGLGGMGGAQPLAVTMNDGVALCIDVDPVRIERRIKTRYLDRETDDLDTALAWADDARTSSEAVSIGLLGNCAEVLPELVATGWQPDIVTDQTSAHDPSGRLRPRGTARSRRPRRCGPMTPTTTCSGPTPRWRPTSTRW